MKKLCMLLAALILLAMMVPAFAEDGAELTQMLEGDWGHGNSEDHYLLFDGVDKFYYSSDESYYYGIYKYAGDNSFLLLDNLGDERTLVVNDDVTLSLEGVDGAFSCNYRYALMDYPNTDAGVWMHESGAICLAFDLYGEFELEDDDNFYFGNYTYLGGGDYQLIDSENVEFIASCYDDGSVGIEGIDGYFWLQDEVTGDDPFEYVKDDAENFSQIMGGAPATPFDSDPVDLMGTWYKNGDASAMPFVLEDGVFSCENSIMGYETTGTWELDHIVKVLSDKETEEAIYISMVADDGMPSGWDPIPMAGNRLLYSDGKDTYFLHESMLDTEEGEMLCRMGDFMRTDWMYISEEEGVTLALEFSCMGNAVIFTSIDEDGESYSEIVGHWTLEDSAIAVTYITDETASYPLDAASILADGLEFVK